MSKKSSFFWGLLVGSSLGAILTFLFTPSSGQNNRDVVSYQFSNIWSKIRGFVQSKEIYNNEARLKGEQHIDFITREAQRLENQVEEISSQIKNLKSKAKKNDNS